MHEFENIFYKLYCNIWTPHPIQLIVSFSNSKQWHELTVKYFFIMSRSCCVVSCKNTNNIEGLGFYSVPANLSIEWRKVIGRGDEWMPKKHTKICGNHFSPHDFSTSGKLKRKLKRGSTPSSNPHDSSVTLGIFLNIHTYEGIGNREGYETSLSQYFFNQQYVSIKSNLSKSNVMFCFRTFLRSTPRLGFWDEKNKRRPGEKVCVIKGAKNSVKEKSEISWRDFKRYWKRRDSWRIYPIERKGSWYTQKCDWQFEKKMFKSSI